MAGVGPDTFAGVWARTKPYVLLRARIFGDDHPSDPRFRVHLDPIQLDLDVDTPNITHIYIYLDLQMSRNKCSRCKLLVLQKSARAANEEKQKQVQFSKVRSCALFCARVRNFALEVRP